MSRRIGRLLFLTDAPHFGGAEQYLLSMCSAARARGVEPCICWLPPSANCANVFATATDVRIETRPTASSSLKALTTTINEVLQTFRPDAAIINAAGRPRFWLTPWLARRAGVPSAWIHHMVDTRDHRRIAPQRLGGRIEGLHCWRLPQALRHGAAAAAADVIIVSNERDRDWLLRWYRAPREKLHVIAPGIDGQRYRRPTSRENRPANDFVVGTAARLVRGKGIERLIEAVATLRSGGAQVSALIAGDGPDAPMLRKLAGQVGVADAVQFLGRVEDMSAFYSQLDAFALCSDTESFGLAIAEAMACEVPVIATPTAGARTQIEHLRTGLLLASNDVCELASALSMLQSDRALRARLACAARVSALERFSINHTFDSTIALLRGPRVRNAGLACECATAVSAARHCSQSSGTRAYRIQEVV